MLPINYSNKTKTNLCISFKTRYNLKGEIKNLIIYKKSTEKTLLSKEIEI